MTAAHLLRTAASALSPTGEEPGLLPAALAPMSHLAAGRPMMIERGAPDDATE